MPAPKPHTIPPPPPAMTTFGLALDTDNKIWQYQGANGMVQIGTFTPVPAAPVNTILPAATVVTNLAVGSLVACSAGTWTGEPPITYARQWLSDGEPISGATATSYTLQASDVDNMISCIVTATNAGGSTAATSNEIGPVVEA